MIASLFITRIFGAARAVCPSDDPNKAPSANCETTLPVTSATGETVQNVAQVVIGIFAVVAVLMIVIAALNIMVAQGDPQKVAKARETIIYALIGLVVAVSAEVIVAFALGSV